MHCYDSLSRSSSGSEEHYQLKPVDPMGISLIKNMRKLPEGKSLEFWHKKGYYTPDEVLYGYYSIMPSRTLFLCMEEVFRKSIEKKKVRTGELIFIVRWLKCGLYSDDYGDVASSIQAICNLSEMADNNKIFKLSRKIEVLWKQATREAPSKNSISMFRRASKYELDSFKTKKLIYCENLDDLILYYDENPEDIAREFRAFFALIECRISPIDILKKQRAKPLKQTIRKNSFSEAANLTDKMARQIMHNILLQDSRTAAELRYALFLEVAIAALKNNDTATAVTIHLGIEGNAIDRLRLLETRPKNAGLIEKLGFDGKKKERKKKYDCAIEQYGEIHKECSFEKGFASIRKIERKSSGSPHFPAILGADVEGISEISSIITRKKITYYNAERLSAFSDFLKSFAEKQQEVKDAQHMAKVDLLNCVIKGNVTEEALLKRSYEIKASKISSENWSHKI